jgi:hypothetical protein
MSAVAASLVALAHLAFVGFVLLAPFSGNECLLRMYVLTIPFVWLHWVLNDDTCALTMLECKLRGVQNTESFVHRIVSPVYKLPEHASRTLAWLVSGALWVVALYRARALGVSLWPWSSSSAAPAADEAV